MNCTYTILDGVKTIGKSAFHESTGLTSVVIPDTVTMIEMIAFYGCSGLTSITIPAKVASIGDQAFIDCDNLKTVYFKGTTEPNCHYDTLDNSLCHGNSFCVNDDIPTDVVVYVPSGYTADSDGFCKLTDVRENQ